MQGKLLQNAPVEHSAVLLTCIKIPLCPHGFKTFVSSLFECNLTGFTVLEAFAYKMCFYLLGWGGGASLSSSFCQEGHNFAFA